jgi:RimJ/RimL family protein N-acetyltransferase
VASTGIVKGAASYCLDWVYTQFPNIRMDTYKDNIPMQKLLEKCGFQYCGSFERLGADKWMAYHKE